jgi:hypothetical protein
VLDEKDYEKIVEWLNFLAVGTTGVVTKEQEEEILDLSCKCFDYAYPDYFAI